MDCRITSEYKPGSRPGKPNGYSEIQKGIILPKGSDRCLYNSYIERLSHVINRALLSIREANYLVDVRLYKFLEWILENTYSFGAFVYLHAPTDKGKIKERLAAIAEQSFNTPTLVNLDRLCQAYCDEVLEAKTEFIHFDDQICLDIDSVRNEIRTLEIYYYKWVKSTEQGMFMGALQYNAQSQVDTVKDRVRFMGEVINRTSSVLYWGTRKVYQDNCSPVVRVQWSGKARDLELDF